MIFPKYIDCFEYSVLENSSKIQVENSLKIPSFYYLHYKYPVIQYLALCEYRHSGQGILDLSLVAGE